MTAGGLVTGFKLDERAQRVVRETLGGVAEFSSLDGLDDAARETVLRQAGAVVSWNTKEFRPHELELLGGAKLIQFMTAGVDFIPFSLLPAHVPMASNGGAYAEPMAEHAVAMVFAAAKRLIVEHNNLASGAFNQFVPNRMLGGAVFGAFGFGGIGVATARLMRGLGMRVHAVNRRGASDEPTDWIGPPQQLDTLLTASDVLLISAPLSQTTRGIMGARELGLMKDDAILLNLARGELIDEAALYAHLRAKPSFTACIDAWWVEPVRHGEFRMEQPFIALPNVIASPHNSASVPAWRSVALARAVANCRRALLGEPVQHLLGAEERLG